MPFFCRDRIRTHNGMATTAIWNVKGWLGHALIYIENPEKTENPKIYQHELNTSENCPLSTVHCQLGDVLDYAIQDKKTLKKWKIEHSHKTLQRFVSGVNCFPDTARAEMIAVKKRFGKEDGNVAFHGYQRTASHRSWPTKSVRSWHRSFGASAFR